MKTFWLHHFLLKAIWGICCPIKITENNNSDQWLSDTDLNEAGIPLQHGDFVDLKVMQLKIQLNRLSQAMAFIWISLINNDIFILVVWLIFFWKSRTCEAENRNWLNTAVHGVKPHLSARHNLNAVSNVKTLHLPVDKIKGRQERSDKTGVKGCNYSRSSSTLLVHDPETLKNNTTNDKKLQKIKLKPQLSNQAN